MATIYQSLQSVVRGNGEMHFNWEQFLRENFARSPWLLLWLIILAYVTLRVVIGQMVAAPLLTAVIVIAWAASVGLTALNEVRHHHTRQTQWLHNNLYNSVSNVLITLLLTMLVVAAIRGFIDWAFIRASFSTDPEVAAQTLARFEDPGANWGAVIDNFSNLMIFRFPRAQVWRIWALIAWNVALFIPSLFLYRERYRGTRPRRILTFLWFITPFVAYVLLRGVGSSGPLAALNPDVAWGGFLLTLIIAFFGVVASFPLGLLLALGRRSEIRGIPAWLTFGAAAILTIWGLLTSTLEGLPEAETWFQRLLALWPLLIPLVAYVFHRSFRGNVVAFFSTLYIEVIRGVPLITVLFMSIILFPLLLPPGTTILGTWRVLVAVALFSAAYLAENVRGGLQAIPKGQYEAADAVGLSTYKKYRLIILPQALRIVIPAIVGQFIALFKDTTLVAIVGITELLGVAEIISAQPDWLGVRREPFVFAALVYFTFNLIIAARSRRLERQLGVGQR